MTDKPSTPTSAAESLKRALAAKKANTAAHTGIDDGKSSEKAVAARAAALAKPAFRKASKRG